MKLRIPASERRQMLQRLALSIAIGAAIAFALATTTERSAYLGAQLVFSISIAVFIWLLADVGDFVLFSRFILFSHSTERFPFSKNRYVYLGFLWRQVNF